MLGDYFTKPQQGSWMRSIRAVILNLPKDLTIVSQECVETCTHKQLGEIPSTSSGTSLCMCNHDSKNTTSLPHDKERRKSKSYLMAAKGLLRKVNNKVNRLDHFIQLY